MMRHFAAAMLAVLTVMAPTAAATVAGVRVCGGDVSARAVAASEAEARRQALRRWSTRARSYGAGYGNWQRARQRTLSCRRAAEGFRCTARARPCAIFQKRPPVRLPAPGSKLIEA